MRLLYGKPLTAADIERLTSEADEKAFVRLCATLVGSAIGESGGGFAVPNWAERISVPDRGIDAEYTGGPDMVEAGGLVGPGRTVYQFKWRRLATRPARSVYQQLRKEMKGALQNMLSRGAVLPDRYVLFSNLDVSGSDHAALVKAIREGCLEAGARPVVIWGAAEVAVALNLRPYVRHAFFSEEVDRIFCTLENALEELRARYAGVGWTDFVGYREAVESIREFVSSDRDRLLSVTGPPYVGKTRTVFEALANEAARVVWASDASALTEGHLRAVEGPEGQGLLVIDNCGSDDLRHLERWARSRIGFKTILITRSSPSWPDVPMVKIEGLSHQECSRLLALAAPNLSSPTADWVGRIAGNNPGLLLYAVTGSRQESGNPARYLGQGDPQRTVRRLLSDAFLFGLSAEEREALQLLSIIPQVGVEEERADELEVLCRLLRRDPLRVRGAIPSLEQRLLLIRRGRYVEVVPEMLATVMAAEAIKGSCNLVPYLWLELGMVGIATQDRFLKRLLDLAGDPSMGGVFEEVFSPTGWFGTLDDLRRQAARFRRLAEVRPFAALNSLTRLLTGLDTFALRESIAGDLRREVIWSLEGLALRAKTFNGAAELLLRLAEGENENVSNNATGVFLSIFHWRHPEISAPHSERLGFLRRHAEKNPSSVLRALVARAAGKAIGHDEFFLLHQSPLSLPPEEPARLPTWGDVWDFHETILGILRGLSKDQEVAVREVAFSALLDGVRESLHISVLRNGLDNLAHTSFDALREVAASQLSLAQVVELRSALELIRNDFELKKEGTAEGGESHEGVRLIGQRLLEIERSLQDDSFSGRLKRWVGPRSRGDQNADDEAIIKGEPAPSGRGINELAESLCGDPSLLTSNQLEWLLTEEAVYAPELFLALGASDSTRTLESLARERALKLGGDRLFGFYVAGRAQADRSSAEEILDSMRTDDPANVRAILAAASLIPGDERNVRRFLRLLGTRAVRPAEALGVVRFGGWIRSVSVEDLARLLRELDDESPEVTNALLDLLGVWILFNRNRGIPKELCERIWALLSRSTVIPNRALASSWDRLAEALAQASPERFLALLEIHAAHTPEDSKGPIDFLQDHARFWKPLFRLNREGVLRTLLSLNSKEESPPFWVHWCLHQFVKPETDGAILRTFASETGEPGGVAIADVIDGGTKEFWSIAATLIAEFPENRRITSRLTSAVGSTGVVGGSFVPTLRQRLEGAASLIGHSHPKVSQWAREVVDWLEDWIRSEEKEDQERYIWDYRVSRRQLEGLLQKKDSPDRLWAIQRILKRAPWKEALELLSADDIREGLERTELPEDIRKVLEEYLRHWRGRG